MGIWAQIKLSIHNDMQKYWSTQNRTDERLKKSVQLDRNLEFSGNRNGGAMVGIIVVGNTMLHAVTSF